MSIWSFVFVATIGIAIGIGIGALAVACFYNGITRLSLKHAARYKAALDIMCEQYGMAADCADCKYKDSCRLFPKDGENDKSLCGEIVKRVIEDRVKKAGIE